MAGSSASAPPPAGAPIDPDRQLTAQGQERKDQLIRCAAELFAERGYAETRIKDIVEAAGVAKGLFYWYFENKEALFDEVAADIRRRLRRHQGAAVDPHSTPLRQLRDGTEASVHFMAEHAPFFSLLEVEADAGSPAARRAGTNQHLRDVRRIIERGQADGSIVDEDPSLLALDVVGPVGYYSHYHRTGRLAVDVDELARYVAASVVRRLATDTTHAEAALR